MRLIRLVPSYDVYMIYSSVLSVESQKPSAQQPDRDDDDNFCRPAADANRIGDHYGAGARDQSQRIGSRG
jgi:hypothetical protein